MKPWSITLLILIIADSVFTVYLGVEKNPWHLWCMRTFDMSLNQVMALRVAYLMPFVWIIDKHFNAKYVVIAYMLIYTIMAGVQFII